MENTVHEKCCMENIVHGLDTSFSEISGNFPVISRYHPRVYSIELLFYSIMGVEIIISTPFI